MEGGESPLDVLSRAATMVQENQTLSSSGMDPEFLQDIWRASLIMRAQENFEVEKKDVFWQPWLDKDDSTKPYTKQTPRWKRERRPRPPDYPRKSSPAAPSPSSPPPAEAPLDMSVRQRGLPPSYAQTISSPCYRAGYRPPLVKTTRDELPSGISMCDPIIDEHFRRSLGSDYHAVFQNIDPPKERAPSPRPISPPKSPESPRMPPVIELMDSSGMSVDEHFAKALGDTWTKLNRKDPEIKTGASGNGLVST
ncbi:unnamed protein product [Phaedon cochleariae]|uniref:Transcription cofactor vestigial-like protein 4 n=1 Tax=Phaedon cochleariae TaxID=80249 RepID=A0A9N9X179_PHACE|nr:unnamed protein product [Phaedon cochleariae]